MITVGLTGNYGMGKSSVLALFRELGAETLDSDAIVAELLRVKRVVKGMKRLLGKEVVDRKGRLDKKAVARKIFSDEQARRALEDYLHPMVIRAIRGRIRALKKKGRVLVVEVPLLFEGGHEDNFDRTITVYSSRERSIARLVKSGIQRPEAVARLRAQMPITLKKKKADFRINNNGSRSELKGRVEPIFRLLKEEAEA